MGCGNGGDDGADFCGFCGDENFVSGLEHCLVSVRVESHVSDMTTDGNRKLQGPQGVHNVSTAAPNQLGARVQADVSDQSLTQLAWKSRKDT